MKVTLKKVFANVKPTKFGDKLSVGLKIEEPVVTDIDGNSVTIGDKYLNAWFKQDFTFPHKEGDVVEILIKQRGEYLDFMLPGVGKAPTVDNGSLIERISKLEGEMKVVLAHLELNVASTATAPADEESTEEDYF